MCAKIALQTDLWYNKALKMYIAAMLQTSRDVRRTLLGGSSMDSLYPHAENGNIPEKRCTGPCGRMLPATTEFFHRNGPHGLYSQCKSCKSQKSKIHNSLPEVQKRRQEYYQAYWQIYSDRPEAQKRIGEYQQSYRQIPEKREHKREYLREYNAQPEVQEHRRERTRSYRDRPEVREHLNERERGYYRNRPEKRQQIRNRVNNRIARRKAAPGTHTQQQIKEQYDRQKGTCYYCKHKVEWGKHHVDHVVPLSRGGSNGISNLVVTCPTCNLRKNNRLPHEWPGGGKLL